MTSKILSTSAAALLLLGAATSQACASSNQWGRRAPYGYEGPRGDRDYGLERRAFENGARDGYDKGIDDLRHRRYPDVRRQKWYRNGDHDYNHRFGPKDEYRAEYRRGFEEGYERAFRQGRRGY